MPAKLVSLKMSAKEAKSEGGMLQPAAKMDLPKYPYGMELRLDTETLAKLGLNLDDYSLGQTCMIEARATVVDTSESQRLGGKERKNMELQITDIAISPDKAAKKAKLEAARLNEASSPTSEDYTEE